MNAIDKAISDVKFKIPKALLDQAFIGRRGFAGLHNPGLFSLDERIKQNVIQARVLPDCNIVGGSETTVYIGDLVPYELPDYKMVWRIPLEKTENRQISKVFNLSVTAVGGRSYANSMYSQTGSSLYETAESLLSSNLMTSNAIDADIELVGVNTIMSHQRIVRSSQLYLRCLLENDEELNNLPRQSFRDFSKLVEYAVKSYLYQILILEVDQGQLSGGSELGRFTSILEGYQDAEENYQDFLANTWAKVAFMSDPVSHKRHLRMLVGPGRS